MLDGAISRMSSLQSPLIQELFVGDAYNIGWYEGPNVTKFILLSALLALHSLCSILKLSFASVVDEEKTSPVILVM